MAIPNAKLKIQSEKLDNTPKATSMAQLMQSAKPSFISVKKGEIIKGKITKLTPSEILVDINAKTEAVVLEKDRRLLRTLLRLLYVGDAVTVSVLNPESDMGHPVVSLRRFADDILWEKLAKLQKDQTSVQGTVTEVTRGGLLLTTSEGIAGFLPYSHMTHTPGEDMQNALGKRLAVYVSDLQRPVHKVILSQKPMMSRDEFEEVVKELGVGKIVEATVATITPFGVFVMLTTKQGKTIDGLVHISEVSWEKVDDVSSLFTVGQTLKAQVIGFDQEGKRADLSIKRLTQDPFQEILKQYAVDQKVKGTVSKVLTNGIVVEIATGIEGFIRKEKIPPTVTFAVGNTVDATVSQVDIVRHRLILVPILKEKPIGYR